MEAAFLELMPHTVQLARRTGRDGFGQPTYGAPTPHRALVMHDEQLVRTADGTDVIAKTVAYIAGPIEIDVEDQLVVPAPFATDPPSPLLSVAMRADETGVVHHAEARL